MASVVAVGRATVCVMLAVHRSTHLSSNGFTPSQSGSLLVSLAKQPKKTHVFGPLPPMKETQMKLQAPGFSLSQP